MGERFVTTRPDGGITITELIDDTNMDKTLFEMSRPYLDSGDPTMTPEELYHWRMNLHFADYTGSVPLTCRPCDITEIPTDRTFRDAWEDAGALIQVNMPQARGIHMDRIRQVRNAELAAKDITFMRAVETGDTSAQAAIATEKQVLRDIPQTFDLTTDTAEQLKAKWPSELPDRE